MFVRKKRNKSGAVSVQIIDKSAGYKVLETIGSSKDAFKINELVEKANHQIRSNKGRQGDLFSGKSVDIEAFIKSILQYLAILAVIVVIKNTNPRVRIDQAVGFFWGPVTILAVISVALAYFGH